MRFSDLRITTEKMLLQHVRVLMNFYELIVKIEVCYHDRLQLVLACSSWENTMKAYDLKKDITVTMLTEFRRKRKLIQIRKSTGYLFWSSKKISLRDQQRNEVRYKIKSFLE